MNFHVLKDFRGPVGGACFFGFKIAANNRMEFPKERWIEAPGLLGGGAPHPDVLQRPQLPEPLAPKVHFGAELVRRKYPRR